MTTHLSQYSSNPKKNWSSKNVSIYLVTALTISGETADKGTTRINEFIPLVTFFQAHILPELIAYPQNHPVIQSDALKFLSSFRNIVCFFLLFFFNIINLFIYLFIYYNLF